VFENGTEENIWTQEGGREQQETIQNCIIRSFIICTLHRILLGRSYREDEKTGHVARMGKMKKCIRKPEGKRPLGKRMT
jgi:hypothetical protein